MKMTEIATNATDGTGGAVKCTIL